jgi:hypothetical protein
VYVPTATNTPPETNAMMGLDPRPLLHQSRCVHGPRRVCPVVWDDDDIPLIWADACLPTVEAAVAAARQESERGIARGGYRAGSDCGQAKAVQDVHRKPCRGVRDRSGARSTEAHVRESPYSDHVPDAGPGLWCAHPVLEKTAERIRTTSRSFGLDDLGTDRERDFLEWFGRYDESAVVRDRLKSERDGDGSCRKRRWRSDPPNPGFHGGRANATPDDRTSQALALLGIESWPCSRAELKAAYRRASRGAHPDAGGSEARFVALRQAFERLMSHVLW